MNKKQISVFVLTLLVFTMASMSIGESAPQLVDNNTKEASPSTYAFATNYGFFVTCRDPSGDYFNVTCSYFESNHTGTKTNYTTTNNTAGVFWYNITSQSASVFEYKWFANDSAGVWNTTNMTSYTINKATPDVKANTRNDSYININGSVRVVVNLTEGARVYIQLANPSTTTNYTVNYTASEGNYTFDISKIQLGDGQNNITNSINITIFVGGVNYTEVSNETTNQLNFSYGKTNSITVTIPDSTTSGEDIAVSTNYTTTETPGGLITANCSISLYSSTYYLVYSSGTVSAGFAASPSNPGNYFTWTTTCTNSSYETQTSTGTIFIGVGAGQDGGGSGGTVTTTTTSAIVQTTCGDGICETGESFWNCMKDCPLSFGEPQSSGGTYNPTDNETGTHTISTTTLVIILVVGYLLLKKR